MIDWEKYFGENGPFAQACNLCRDRLLPPAVSKHAGTLGKSDTAYQLGWSFAHVLETLHMDITPQCVSEIAHNKISFGDPQEFINGFNDRGKE